MKKVKTKPVKIVPELKPMTGLLQLTKQYKQIEYNPKVELNVNHIFVIGQECTIVRSTGTTLCGISTDRWHWKTIKKIDGKECQDCINAYKKYYAHFEKFKRTKSNIWLHPYKLNEWNEEESELHHSIDISVSKLRINLGWIASIAVRTYRNHPAYLSFKIPDPERVWTRHILPKRDFEFISLMNDGNDGWSWRLRIDKIGWIVFMMRRPITTESDPYGASSITSATGELIIDPEGLWTF